MSHPARLTRGSAMVETAIVLSTMLLMLFGGLQIALAGYYQVAADGAVYLAAHYYALGGAFPGFSLTPLGGAFPGVDLTQISFAAASPDPVQEPVDYGYSNSSGYYGGAQMIRPEHLQASYSTSVNGLLNILGFNAFPITAGAVEGRDWLANHDLNVNETDPNSSNTTGSMIDPLYTDDQNVPPYYIGSNDIIYCPLGNWSADGSTCNQPYVLALGLAEYLDSANYGAPNNGVGTQATFRAMLCHQQVYANLLIDGGTGIPGIALPQSMPIYDPNNDPWVPALDQNSSDGTQGASGYFAEVYDWDNFYPSGYPTYVNPGRFPLQPMNGCPP